MSTTVATRKTWPLASRVPVALLFTAVAAVLLQRYGQVPAALALLPAGLRNEHIQLNVRILWAAIYAVFYIAIPLVLVRAYGLGKKDLGFELGATRRHLWVVAAVALCGLPLVLWASRSASFHGAYPLYRPWHPMPVDTVLWLAVFGAYLFSVEFFFRGFLLAMLMPALGRYALLASLIPYVATHSFLPEALGAIPVGLLLSVLRLRAGSIWPGFLAHYVVALQIELIALGRHGLFWG